MSKPETKFLKFTETKKTKSATDPQTFERGRIYGFTSEASYNRWLIRGAKPATPDEFRAQLAADKAAKDEAAKPPGQPIREGEGGGQGDGAPKS